MLSFGAFSKEYNVPRTSVYDIMNKLKDDNIELYNKYVDSTTGTNKLNKNGIQYILDVRGSNTVETRTVQPFVHKKIPNEQPKEKKVIITDQSDKEIISLLKKELSNKEEQLKTKDKQLDVKDVQLNTRDNQIATLQKNYDDMAKQLKETNDHLIEMNKNQQALMNQLQQTNLLDKIEQHKDNDRTEVYESSDAAVQPKKGFWKRLFS